MTAPRKPTADSANAAAATRPMQRRLQIGKTLAAGRPQRCDDDADGGDQDRDHLQHGQMIAEKDKAEDRGLDRLGLQIRRRHHERAVVHGKQHHAGAGDLAQCAEQQPRPERSRRPRHVVAAHRHHDRKEQDRERKAEQEADIGRAPGAERPRQRSLHRIARDLAERSNDGEGNPERGDGEHWGYRRKGAHRAGRGARGQPNGA